MTPMLPAAKSSATAYTGAVVAAELTLRSPLMSPPPSVQPCRRLQHYARGKLDARGRWTQRARRGDSERRALAEYSQQRRMDTERGS
jgi:hypothetical protein